MTVRQGKKSANSPAGSSANIFCFLGILWQQAAKKGPTSPTDGQARLGWKATAQRVCSMSNQNENRASKETHKHLLGIASDVAAFLTASVGENDKAADEIMRSYVNGTVADNEVFIVLLGIEASNYATMLAEARDITTEELLVSRGIQLANLDLETLEDQD